MNPEFKKILRFLIIVLAALLVVDYIGYKVLNHFFYTMHRGREYNTRVAMMEARPELLFVGASQCQGNYDPSVFLEGVGLSGFNAGMGGQHIDYQVVVASSVMDRSVPKVIIWDFDPKLLASDNGVYLKTGLNPYYHQNEMVKTQLDARDRFMPLKQLIFSYRYNSLLMQIINGNLGASERQNGYTPYTCGKLKKMETVDENSYRRLGDDTDRKVSLMRHTLEDWKSRGIEVYVVVSPMHKKIEAPIAGISEAEKICEEVGVPFLDYSQLAGIYDVPSNFRDHIHLCKVGAELYSRRVVDELIEYNNIHTGNE